MMHLCITVRIQMHFIPMDKQCNTRTNNATPEDLCCTAFSIVQWCKQYVGLEHHDWRETRHFVQQLKKQYQR